MRQSKALYTKIYNASHLTEKLTNHLLSDRNNEKGALYKLGKVLVDSCINTDLISKAASQESHTMVFNSFCLLIILDKINSLNKLKTNSEAIIAFTN